MDIKPKLYPYPVLTSLADDYKNTSRFDIDVAFERTKEEIVLNFSANLVNDELKGIIEKGAAQFVCHIECPQTALRKATTSQAFSFSERLMATQVKGRLEICPFIVATQSLSRFRNNDFNDEYGGYMFDIEHGCVLGVGKQCNLDVSYENSDLADLPSVFSIIPNFDSQAKAFLVDAEGQKITIKLPEKDFYTYKAINKDITFRSILVSMVVIPALSEALETLARKGDERSESCDLAWYKAVNKKMKQELGFYVEDNKFMDEAKLHIAQSLLGTPISKALQTLETISTGEDDQ